MTDTAPADRPGPARRKPALHRTVLGIVVAALVAAWLPFSILYIDALSRHSASVAKTAQAAPGAQTTSAAGNAATAPSPVTTRVS